MPTKVKDRRKPTQVSSRSGRSSAENKLPRLRYFGKSRTGKNTKRINHPNFVSPLTKNYVDVNQNNLNITYDNSMVSPEIEKIDYVKLVKDLYPQVKDYLYIFEHELSSKHNDPKEFFLWMLNGLSELNQTYDLIAFDYSPKNKKYQAQIIKELKEFVNGGQCTDIFWLNTIPDSEDKRMLMRCIKMLVEDIKLPVYWWSYSDGRIEFNDDIEQLFEFVEEEDEQEHKDAVNEYKTVALDLAKEIMSQELNYYDILEYSESDGKYAEFAKHAWKLVKNNFRLYNYSSVAHIKYNEWVNLDDPYIGLHQIYSIFYRIDESDPIFWHLDQQFQQNANEYGVETAVNIIPIMNPEKEKLNADLFKSFNTLFDLLHNYGYRQNV